MTVPNESSEDVSDFLQRIRELGERRDKEDDERTKKLEEEIIQGRKERQARRAERARSLALTDDSPILNVARLSVSSISSRSIDPPEQLEPTSQTPAPETPSAVEPNQEMDVDDTMDKRRGSVPDIGLDSPSRVRPPVSRSRAGTLPWQQRPSSRDAGSMSPGSTSPTRSPTRTSHLRNLSTASDDNTLSRLQFGFPRPSKDTPVFPPSPDRGVGSPADRGKEEETDKQTNLEVEHQEPDVSQESSAELDKLETVEEGSSSPPTTGSRDSNISHRFSVSSVSAAGLGSPVHLSEAPKLEPRQNDSSFEELIPASPSQRRLSPERPRSTSPTKGLGGFVQSAMMRRSDSVSKRWSGQVSQGLSRSNSIVSNRSSVGPGLSEMTPPTLSRIGREPSTLLQRPGSSHSDAPSETTERPVTPSTCADRDSVRLEGSPGKSFRPAHSRSASSTTADGTDGQTSPFVSKTMDSRRWSPSKASWLESALNRPEMPRQTTRPPPQPSWVKERQSRGSVDMGRVNSFKEVTPLGLMRTPPPGTQLKTSAISGPSLPTSPTKDGGLESPLEFPFKKLGLPGPSLPASPTKDIVLESPLEFRSKRPGLSGPSLPASPTKDIVPESPLEFPFKKPGVPGPSLPTSPMKDSVPESPLEFPFKKPDVSGSSLPTSPIKDAIPESPSEFSLKRSSLKGPSIPTSPAKEVAPESPSALAFEKSSISGDSTTADLEDKSQEIVPESPSGFPFKKPSISGSSIHRSSITESPAEFPFKKSSVSGSSIHRNSVTETPAEFPFKKSSVSGSSLHRNSVTETPAEFPFKKSSVSGSSLYRNSVTETPAEFPFKKSSVSGSSLHRNSVTETPAEFPFKKSSVSGSSLHRNSVTETPAEFPFKKSSVSGSSLHRSSVTETPAEFPFKKSSVSGSSLHRSSVAEAPAEFPFKKSSVSGSSLAESPRGRPGSSGSSLHRSSISESPAEFPLKRPSISGPSITEMSEIQPEEIVPESPSVLDSPVLEEINKEIPGPPSGVQEALDTLSSATPVEEIKPTSPLAVETELQEQQPSTEPEDTIESHCTPIRRAPPDSLSPKPNFSISTSTRGPISPKAKTPQSPVVDFRANLRKREVVKDSGNEKEPEFKNVFGRLKKTEPRHYVAPDELKGNILRGKAALNNTGGPKKPERVDEFRKSLVLRKDEMKAGGGSIRRNTAGENDAPKSADIVPEAIAMRQNMTRANSIKQDLGEEPISPAKSFSSRASQDRPPFSPPSSSFKDIGSSPTSQKQPLSPLSPFRTNDEPGWPLRDPVSSRASQETQPLSPPPVEDPVDEKLKETNPSTNDFQEPSFPQVDFFVRQEETRSPVEAIEPCIAEAPAPAVKPIRPVRAWPPAAAAEATVTPGPAAKGKLASRINPALLGLLSRGPPAPEGPKKQMPTAVSTQSDSTSPSAPLTHITKGRARGPKRRLPQTTDVLSPSSQDDIKEVGAISHSEATPSHTPAPVDSSDLDPDRISQLDENSVPDTEEPRPDSPIIDLSTEVKIASQDTLQRDTLEHDTLEHDTLEPDTLEHDSLEREPLERDTVEREPLERDTVERDTVERDTVERDTVEHDTLERDTAERDILERDTPERDTIERDTVERVTVERDTVEHDTLERDTAERDTLERDTPERDTIERDTLDHDSLVRDTLERDTLERDTLERDTVERDTLERDTTERYTPERDTPERDTIERDTPERDTLERDTLERDTLEHEPLERDTLERDTPERDTLERDTLERDTLERDTAERDTLERDTPKHDTLEREPLERDTPERDTLEHDTLERDTLEHDTLEHEPLERDTLERDTPERDTLEHDTLERDTLERDTLERDTLKHDTLKHDTLERDTSPHEIPQTPQTGSQTTESSISPSPSRKETPRVPESPKEMYTSNGPPVPPKSEHPTLTSPALSKPTWGLQNRFASSLSSLRASHKVNQMESISQPKSNSVTIESARSSVARPLSRPSPPVPPKDTDERLEKPIDPRRLSRKMSAPSLVAQASEAHEVIAGFFKTFPNPRNRMDIDPQLMLMRKPDDVKIRTMRRQIWELTGDGRRQELPSHQEYILYQGSMYICVHTFEIGRSTTSDVYLWRGDDVPESSVDDEQPFARKVARENSAKLQIIRQGKEPTRFIQALGGIMITRRGSSSRHNSSALYMLCGRKHLGEMTFDEVDYSLRNLCSGFPYVVSAPFGKLYLWKGKGSGPEETGAARLIGMDLGLTGEFEEVTEGEEPEDFFDVFAGPREPAPHMCQDHWQLKPKYNQFRMRLLRVDHELNQPTRFWNIRRPGSGSPVVKANDCVQEIEPFCYRDITEKDIYVLDTFFEIYVIIGEQASHKAADFASAVVFAHEYGILATSLQDRPFIPRSFVALGGVADRCQSAFRKWDQRTQHAPFVFPLDAVIEAIRSRDERA
ncbi:Small GTPase superfamily ARF/SAR type [Penicillium paradoxum]|uniref:Small GTPase superfamily ARF/SAR type n=1 Tax=Penicillium paradoxum TaxID=176176 RepID=UPI002546B8AB|nr:Small GTPase superfamily ARF/SAR type [Penicillium paradoxum]KAJ5774910.1 Small GTPase superfamily ARF/SAR type [Penicillium paradoxum]